MGIEGDPLISEHESFVIFFKIVETGVFRTGPTNRFKIDADGSIRAVVPNGVQVPAGTTADGLTSLL